MFQFIESQIFSKQVYDYLTDDEYAEFQQFLSYHLDAGAVVRGSGGVRKVRWGKEGAGKSGGVRIIYFTRTAMGQVVLLLIYSKSAQDSVPGHALKKIKEAMEDGFKRKGNC